MCQVRARTCSYALEKLQAMCDWQDASHRRLTCSEYAQASKHALPRECGMLQIHGTTSLKGRGSCASKCQLCQQMQNCAPNWERRPAASQHGVCCCNTVASMDKDRPYADRGAPRGVAGKASGPFWVQQRCTKFLKSALLCSTQIQAGCGDLLASLPSRGELPPARLAAV